MGALYSLWEQGVRGCSGRGEGGSGHLSNGPHMSRGTHRTAWAAPVVRGGRARADFEDGAIRGLHVAQFRSVCAQCEPVSNEVDGTTH